MEPDEFENEAPKISEETKKKMLEFFMRTSIPRILAERNKSVKTGGSKEMSSNFFGK